MINVIENLYKSFVDSIDEKELHKLKNGESLAKHLGSDFSDYLKSPEKYKTENEKSYSKKIKDLNDSIKK